MVALLILFLRAAIAPEAALASTSSGPAASAKVAGSGKTVAGAFGGGVARPASLHSALEMEEKQEKTIGGLGDSDDESPSTPDGDSASLDGSFHGPGGGRESDLAHDFGDVGVLPMDDVGDGDDEHGEWQDEAAYMEMLAKAMAMQGAWVRRGLSRRCALLLTVLSPCVQPGMAVRATRHLLNSLTASWLPTCHQVAGPMASPLAGLARTVPRTARWRPRTPASSNRESRN